MNYIVSGLERSGTSLMMQILEEAGFPVDYDNSRKIDEHNPNGYYELYNGKILNLLNKLDLEQFDDSTIKITSHGLKDLPEGDYKVIYMIRNLDEIYESQEKMLNGKQHNTDKDNVINILHKININAMEELSVRNDIKMIYIRYDILMEDPECELARLSDFLRFDVSQGINVIDDSLWRCRSKTTWI